MMCGQHKQCLLPLSRRCDAGPCERIVRDSGDAVVWATGFLSDYSCLDMSGVIVGRQLSNHDASRRSLACPS